MGDETFPNRLARESISAWLSRAVPDLGPDWSVDDPDPLCRLAARLACCSAPYPPKHILYSDRPWTELLLEHFPDRSILAEAPAGWIAAVSQRQSEEAERAEAATRKADRR